MGARMDDLLASANAVRKSTDGNLATYKIGAAAREFGFDISDQEADAMFRAPCHYCGYLRPERFNGIDRVDNSRGYVAGNVVACCAYCNRAKGRYPLADFLDWLRWVRSGSVASQGAEADFSGVTFASAEVLNDRAYLDEDADPSSHVDLRGLSPQEYVRRKVWREPLPSSRVKPILEQPGAGGAKLSQPLAAGRERMTAKVKAVPVAKPIPALRSHNFKGEPLRRKPLKRASLPALTGSVNLPYPGRTKL